MTGPRDGRDELRSRLGRVGIWSFGLQMHAAADEQTAVEVYESLGYGAIWFPESLGSKEAFAHASVLLGGGSRIPVASGIANIYARDPMAMANGAATLAEAHPGRFVLGIGVSHAPSVATRGAVYDKPVPRMRAYLDAMEAAEYAGPRPAEPAPVMLAALGPRMLELAAERTAGGHTYFVPVEHTRLARERLGDALLAVEQTAVLETDESRARQVQRRFAARYLDYENYANNLRRLGWSDEAIALPGSDALLDAVIVRGDAATIAERVRQHLDAGADHVCVQLRAAESRDLCLEAYGELAEALGTAMGRA